MDQQWIAPGKALEKSPSCSSWSLGSSLDHCCPNSPLTQLSKAPESPAGAPRGQPGAHLLIPGPPPLNPESGPLFFKFLLSQKRKNDQANSHEDDSGLRYYPSKQGREMFQIKRMMTPGVPKGSHRCSMGHVPRPAPHPSFYAKNGLASLQSHLSVEKSPSDQPQKFVLEPKGHVFPPSRQSNQCTQRIILSRFLCVCDTDKVGFIIPLLQTRTPRP